MKMFGGILLALCSMGTQASIIDFQDLRGENDAQYGIISDGCDFAGASANPFYMDALPAPSQTIRGTLCGAQIEQRIVEMTPVGSGGTVRQAFAANGIAFDTFQLSSIFVNLGSVVFTALGPDDNNDTRPKFEIDHIAVGQDPAPEPTALVLFSLCLFGFAASRRKAGEKLRGCSPLTSACRDGRAHRRTVDDKNAYLLNMTGCA